MQDVEVSGIQSVAEAAERRALSRREADDIAVERSQGFKQFTRGTQMVVTKSGDGHVSRSRQFQKTWRDGGSYRSLSVPAQSRIQATTSKTMANAAKTQANGIHESR